MSVVFDGHNDILLRLWRAAPEARMGIWLEGDGKGHLDLPRMRRGGFAGGFFAIYIPSPGGMGPDDAMAGASYDLALPPQMSVPEALPVAIEQAAILLQMERAADGFRIVRSSADLAECLATGTIAAIMHMEGAEAIGADLAGLDVLHAAGLRSLGPVWSRPTIFGHGVPFRFPGSPDTGPGLTEAGTRLVRECNARRIMIDCSHLNEAGFWDVARLSDAPLVATHSNVHAICPSTRNLTDRQLHAIRDTGGMVGLNFAVSFLRPDGRQIADTGLEVMLRHLDHMIAQAGIDQVGFGSDFDGATIPQGIGDVAGLPALIQAMAAHGYDAATIAKLGRDNWSRVLRATWG